MAVRRLLILWSLVLYSLAEDALPYGSPGQWKTLDVSSDQTSRIQKTNNVDLHDDSNPPARTIVRISGGPEDITSPNRHITELAHNLNESIMEAQELEPKQGDDFWIWMPQGDPESILFGHGPNLTPERPFSLYGTGQDALDDYSRRPSDPVVATNIHQLFLRNPFHGEMFSGNAQSPSYTNTDISYVQSPHSSSSEAALRQSDFLLEKTSAPLGNNINDKERLIQTIPLPVVGNQASNSVKNFLKNQQFVRKGNHLQSPDLNLPIYDIDHNEYNRLDLELDSVGTGVSEENKQFGSDYEDMNTLDNNVKRKFDSISSISSFGGLGKRQDKRKFDSISSISSFGGFGKRQDKRKFDSISSISSFGGFGKRQDKRKFDSISSISSFGGFGKRQDKRKFDSISGISSFGGFGKRQDKRKFDSISSISSFGGFGKRQDKRKFDSISSISSFGGFGKRQDTRKFDSISGISSFGGFGKRSGKRKFDSISGISSFGRFGKRQDKRKLDSISDISSFGRFGKRQDKKKFDSISDSSSFGGFGKRLDKTVLYPISVGKSLGRLNKRSIREDRNLDYTLGNMEMFEKRKFDSISGGTSFRNFGKRQVSDRENFLSTSAIGAFDPIDKSLDDYYNLRNDYSLKDDKRRFDSISRTSSFGSFGKRQEQENKQADAVSEGGKSESFENGKLDSKLEFGLFDGSSTTDAQHKRQVGTVSVASSFGGSKSKDRFRRISPGSHVDRLMKQQTDDRTVESISGHNPLGTFAAENKGLYFYPDFISFQNVGLNTAKTNYKTVNLRNKGNIVYRNEGGIDDVYKEVRMRHDNNSRRDDEYNTLYALIHELGNIEQTDNNNLNSNNKDSEDMDGWRINKYGNTNSIDNVPAQDSEKSPQVYNSRPLAFKKRKLHRIDTNSIFSGLGKRTLATGKYNSKSNRQSEEDMSKRRFDRISTQSNVFRSFGKRSARNVNTLSQFGELQKRNFDRISGTSRFGRLGKRAFDIFENSSPGGFRSNIFNTPDTATAAVNWPRQRQYSEISSGDSLSGFSNRNTVDLGSMAKKRVDSIDHSSAFQIFAKKLSVTGTSAEPELDQYVVIFRNRHPFPELPRQTQEPPILDSPSRAAPDNVQDFFLGPREEDGHADSVGHPGLIRSSDSYSRSRWS